jgi:hypothetical protein
MLIECRLHHSLSARYDHKIVPVNTPEHHARLFLEEISVKLVAVHQPDATLPIFSFLRKALKLYGCSGDLRAQVSVRLESTLSYFRMVQKISYSET